MQFKHLHFDDDDEGDHCLHCSFVARKSLVTYNENKKITFFIYDNPGEPYINAYHYIMEYFNLIAKHKITISPDSYVFPNMREKHILFKSQGSTDYYRKMVQSVAQAVGLEAREFGNHSLRYGGARHKLIFSMYSYNLDQIQYIAGWIIFVIYLLIKACIF